MGKVLRALRCLTTTFAFPGLMYVALGLGLVSVDATPPEMRMEEKFEYVSLPISEPFGAMVCCAIGIGKIGIALNNWIIKSRVLDLLFALSSVPGFGLVLFVHRSLPNPDPCALRIS